MNYINENDKLWLYLADIYMYKHMNVEKVPLKSLKLYIYRIDHVCLYCSYMQCTNLTKLIEYYAWHGEIDKILPLLNNKIMMTRKAMANALGSCRNTTRFMELYRDEHNFDNGYSYTMDHIYYMQKPLNHMPAFTAARYGNLEALKLIPSRHIKNESRWVIMAAHFGQNDDIVEWLLQNGKFLNESEMHIMNMFIAIHQNDVSFIMKSINQTFIRGYITALLAFHGRIHIFEKIYDKMDLNTYMICIYAIAGNQLAMLKWLKKRKNINFDGLEYDVSYSYKNKKMAFESGVMVDSLYEMYNMALIWAELPVVKWMFKNIPLADFAPHPDTVAILKERKKFHMLRFIRSIATQ